MVLFGGERFSRAKDGSGPLCLAVVLGPASMVLAFMFSYRDVPLSDAVAERLGHTDAAGSRLIAAAYPVIGDDAQMPDGSQLRLDSIRAGLEER